MEDAPQKPEVIDLSNEPVRTPSVLEKWARRETGLVIAALLRYNDEHNARADALNAGTPESETVAPVLERLGYTMKDRAVMGAAFALQQCTRGDGRNPSTVFAQQILDLRDLEKEGVETWKELRQTGFPELDAACPCGSRKTFKDCCLKPWEIEEAARLKRIAEIERAQKIRDQAQLEKREARADRKAQRVTTKKRVVRRKRGWR